MRWRESEYIKHNINKVGRKCTTGVVTSCCTAHLQPGQDLKTGSATQTCPVTICHHFSIA